MKTLSFGRFMRGLAENKRYMLAASLLFVAGIVLGTLNAGSLQRLLSSQLEGLQTVAQSIQQTDNAQFGFFRFIFLNNAIKAVMVMLLGAFFGIAPFVFLVINGGVIGFIVMLYGDQGQDVSKLIFQGLLPHGIIEIPAIVIACAYGLKFGMLVLGSLFSLGNASKRAALGVRWENGMLQMLGAAFWVVILLLVAAVIESTLTLYLLG
ncbi:stage II sporulation protein M [Saccharibacillus sp. CPCC 101409]|uniref:stage II sporulation protein M n=1 Tax=Saccharibacillus sp. CPCC 101409 TaxID=3058041 RepID=UPI002670F040|nr:stage II sporulation protein M [Saccharibacillus sp. CPCC 101409]MDO3412931.1 stage II sporulation protein M [Saccharibacillus sp. CPCC 101409]